MRIEIGIDQMDVEQLRSLAKQQRESIDSLSAVVKHYDQHFVEVIEKNAIEKFHNREIATTTSQRV